MTTPQYPQPGPYPVPSQRKRRVWPWIVIGTAVLLMGGCFVLVGTASKQASDAAKSSTVPVPVTEVSSQPSAQAPIPAPVTATIPPLTAKPQSGPAKTIVYEIVSDAATLNSVTYFDENSAEQQDLNAGAPWSKTVVNRSTYAIAGIGAQTNGKSVTCRITVDGQVKDEKTATGQYAVVNCTASVS